MIEQLHLCGKGQMQDGERGPRGFKFEICIKST